MNWRQTLLRFPNLHFLEISVFLQVVLCVTDTTVAMADGGENDKNIEIWKVKKLIRALDAARGNGTSMISLIIPLVIKYLGWVRCWLMNMERLQTLKVG